MNRTSVKFKTDESESPIIAPLREMNVGADGLGRGANDAYEILRED